MTRIITANLNGIRSTNSKGFFNWLATQNADILCLQELKAQADVVESQFAETACGMKGAFQYADKKGYSGVALYSRHAPDEVIIGFDNGGEFDREGRVVEAVFGTTSIISAYFPSGSADESRQAAKYRFLDLFLPHLQARRAAGQAIILCGDINIAHHEIDLKNWRGNLKNSGFLPEERAWLTRCLTELDMLDVHRHLHPDTAQYTWWSNRGQAYANNVGWRIDYQLASRALALTARTSTVYTTEKFSDHAPCVMDYDFDLTS